MLLPGLVWSPFSSWKLLFYEKRISFKKRIILFISQWCILLCFCSVCLGHKIWQIRPLFPISKMEWGWNCSISGLKMSEKWSRKDIFEIPICTRHVILNFLNFFLILSDIRLLHTYFPDLPTFLVQLFLILLEIPTYLRIGHSLWTFPNVIYELPPITLWWLRSIFGNQIWITAPILFF